MKILSAASVGCVLLLTLATFLVPGVGGDNLIGDPSFEEPKEKDSFGRVFARWAGWIYDGECSFQVSSLAHSGKHSLLMTGGNAPKIRIWPSKLTLSPGRYRVTAYLRGLDIGVGKYGETTEFMFAGKYMNLKRNGSFGWSKLTFVGDVTKREEVSYPSFGLLAPGYLWVDDVSLERVTRDVPLTESPRMDAEENAIEPPGAITRPVSCSQCGYRNDLSWGRCYACGTELREEKKATGPAVRGITSFEQENPFSGGTVVSEHATDGSSALKIARGYASMDQAQNWQGYDYLEADLYTDAKRPLPLNIEIRDRQTTGYWSRVNYNTVAPPGASKLIVPTALYVGEKSRPGRPLMLEAITRLVFALGDNPEAPLFIDNIRLTRDSRTAAMRFDGLWAFDVGPAGSPLMEGFTPLDPSKNYSRGRGYGWKNARIWRAFDALQPDPLHQDFLCLEQGGLAVDVPNGRYHVFVHMDSPSGYWGEFQKYRKRALIVEGTRIDDEMDLESFKKKYFRFFDVEDLPEDNTFDRYQIPYFEEKQIAVDVTDGQLNIDFEGENWACCVSSIVFYPASKRVEGKRFREYIRERRRFHFDNAFKRVLHLPDQPEPSPSAGQTEQGYILFQKPWMTDVYHNDRPAEKEQVSSLEASAFAGEYEPITFSVYPLRDLGKASVTVSDLIGPGKTVLPSSRIHLGHVRHRLSRVTMEGSVYTIAPRNVFLGGKTSISKGLTRTFWLTARVPQNAPPGVYEGKVTMTVEKGGTVTLPLKLTVRKGSLDPVDIPVGPWGHTIDLPWYREEVESWNRVMAEKSLRRMRAYGFTTASGLPALRYLGFKNGRPRIDFSTGDAQMQMFRENGFRMPVVTYCPFENLSLYTQDNSAMKQAGFDNYSAFVKAVFDEVRIHGEEMGWLPVYWNIGDEPIGDDLVRCAENAEAYRRAFPKGPPYFTAASSFRGSNTSDPHFRLSRALTVANWNEHDETSVRLLHEAGGNWAFYNGGNRWTHGYYLYKAAKQFRMAFRLSWHWNISAGDPFYALDCREDDYAWCISGPDGTLIPTIHFERLREGLDDYRRLLTLARLCREKKGNPVADEGSKWIEGIMSSFKLGDRDNPSPEKYQMLRSQVDELIEKLRPE